MSQSPDNNKRIAKNTLVLYVRMLLLMGVSLYTSRVTLATLGVTDYGVYNVVGGIVSMFGFLNGCMAGATQRFMTFALGAGDMPRLKKVFSTGIEIHFVIATIIALLGEIVGVWFLYNKLQIPADRMDAAFWVLQCSIAMSFVGIISVPYNADIVAHEKMSAFAYMSILEGVLKLAIVFLLYIIPVDKMILFAVLLLTVQIFMRYCYNIYCKKHFEEATFHFVWDKPLFKEMTSFAGWSVLGNIAEILFGQGLNMLLNIFFGPVVNAARAVALQVRGAILNFVGSFQMALNPQITKTYAQNDLHQMHMLMFRSARFSFLLLFFISLPVLFETNFVLNLWLKEVPANTVIFLRIMICTSLMYTIANPMIIASQSTGVLKKYQMVCATMLMMILPISYILLLLGCPAYSVFIVHFVMELLTQMARMIMLRPLIKLKIWEFFNEVYARILIVVGFSVLLPGFVYLKMQDNVVRFFVVGGMCVLSVAFFSYLFGMSKHEKEIIKGKLKVLIVKCKRYEN